MACGNYSILGNNDKGFIKFQGSEIVAVQGANIMERLNLKNIAIPYKQIMKGRIVLKAGETSCKMNHLGLGDNATFLAILPIYDVKSKLEENNYITFSFVDNVNKSYPIGQIMILTGNSEHRLPHLLLNNPNSNYSVQLDILVGVIDENSDFFPENECNEGIIYKNMKYENIKTLIPGESIYFIDDKGKPIVHINIKNLISMMNKENILIINDPNIGEVYLEFSTKFDALQAMSLIKYAKRTCDKVEFLNPMEDLTEPYIFFNGANDVYTDCDNTCHTTADADEFKTTITSNDFFPIESNKIIDLIFGKNIKIYDNRDGEWFGEYSNFDLYTEDNVNITTIYKVGVYILRFNISDTAGNSLKDKSIKIFVI